ncbi:hypothetical protein SAMN05421780_10639 [Flexibacter flexilis DSM 6793]|uniref:Polysaccharide deacetylase n=1 Tax=Flexibacter flexilis DSM 6793 TaxID=927664 RepID=A0A1I1JKX1_9BACT|nr:polysaccharide deacetylase [Flexibacter flexilis]SFC49207.1 hypothetical protein SAMN05421780_10639 [Flexibacter flexilis DSM 6793]
MKKWNLLLIGLLIYGQSLTAQTLLSNYVKYFGTATYATKQLILTRQFQRNDSLFYVCINPQNIDTYILPAQQLTNQQASTWPLLVQTFKQSAYIQAIEAAYNNAKMLQDAGVKHGDQQDKGISLTIDLCPSHKPLDRVIFSSLINEFKNIQKPVPVALSLTGRFLLTHSEDIAWLKNLEKMGDINITWINHTYNHRCSPNIPLRENFLLEPNTDVNFEILGTEVAMIQAGLLPSAFFRFPGLVSDQKVLDKVISYGLIPVGSDAWLAKGQAIHNGSIVLIHGNGNEPVGVKDFIKLLQTEKKKVLQKQWLLYDLRQNLEQEFEQ